VIVRFYGTRGSVPTPGPATQRYGGNTSCVEVRQAGSDSVVVLDAGTGICVLGATLPADVRRVDVLLTHLHMDHIIGLGFFAGLFRPGLEVHIWGPSSPTQTLRSRLSRYLSPPLFPVRLRDLPCRLTLHDVPLGTFDVPGFSVSAALVCHPGPTVGYRLDDGTSSMAYLSDHEPALGCRAFPDLPQWMSGLGLAGGVDLLIHDAQYANDEYEEHVGWGHSSIGQAITFGRTAGVDQLVTFHHDPWHDDKTLDILFERSCADADGLRVVAAQEGATFALP
jgi:phosphoribosyl 1,2-cyclic phosphodiesterase